MSERGSSPRHFKKFQHRSKIHDPHKKAQKKGIPLYPNLVNLKSNTMKNTMQR